MARTPANRARIPVVEAATVGGQREDGDPTDEERLELVTETVRGARWLLLMACQGIEGAPAFRNEAQEVKRGLALIDELCKRLASR